VPSPSNYAASARQQAHQILSGAPYTTKQPTTPHPLAGVLHAIGRGLEVAFGPALRWIEHRIIHPIGSGASGLLGGWAPVVGVVSAVAIGVLLALLLVRRRSRIAARTEEQRKPTSLTNPDALEAEADDLAAEGAFSAALRLRFEAGLLRLERAGLIADQQTSTDAELADRLGSPTFDRLALRHEAVAYAGQVADEGDVDHARSAWPQVPDEARSSRKAAEMSAR
jgi:hypothetical protein